MRDGVRTGNVTAVRAAHTAAVLLCTGCLGALGASGSAGARIVGSRAHASRSLSVKDEGKLHLVRSSGSTIFDEGPAHGTIPGTVKLHFVYNGNPTVTSQLTIYGHGGTIQAHATGRLSSPTSAMPSFSGTMTITAGTGRYHGAHGTGHLYGVFNRRTYALTVQTEGSLSY